MADPMERRERDQRLLRSLFSEQAISQAKALQGSLEPDPAADPVARIDQAWIKESTKYAAMDSTGVIAAPNRASVLGLFALFVLLGPGLVILSLVFGKVIMACFGVFGSLFFFEPMLLALRSASVYTTAAAAYRQRRAAATGRATARLGGADEAAARLPIVDDAVWVGQGLISLEEAIARLHDKYGFSNIGAREYQRNRAALLAAAPADERAFYEELMALEYDWAVQRRKLAVARDDDAHWRVPPTVDRARKSAIAGIVGSLVFLAVAAFSGAGLIMALFTVLIGGLILIEAWSTYRKAGRYELAQAEYLRRREELLARQRWQQRSAG